MQERSTIQNPSYVPIEDGRRYVRPVDTSDAEKNRFLTFVGSTITPEIVRNRPWLKAGGIAISNHCLRYVKYYLRQCRITPLLEDQHDPVPPETVDPNDKSYYKILPPAGYVPPAVAGQAAIMPEPLMSKRVLPGDQIPLILTGEQNIYKNMPRGVVELRSLKGFDYRPQALDNGLYLDPEIWKMQSAIFPTYPVLPGTILEVRDILDKAWEVHTSLRDIIEDFQLSSQQFENFARTVIEQAHLAMNQTAASVGYAMQYTGMHLVLLTQLGMKRKDREFQMTARMTGDGGQQSNGSNIAEIKEMFQMFREASREERDALMGLFEKKMAAQEAIAATEMPNPIIEPDSPEIDLPNAFDDAVPVASIGENTMMAQAPEAAEDAADDAPEKPERKTRRQSVMTK